MTIQSVADLTSFKWGTITAVAPLAVKLDGDTAALALIPESLVDPATLTVGKRVRVELSLRKCVIHGVNNGTKRAGGIATMTASLAAGANVTIPVVFPVGLFTSPPIVVALPGATRINPSYNAVTKDGFNLVLTNWQSTTQTAVGIMWLAMDFT